MFRDLFDRLHHCESHSVYWYALVPWLEEHQQEIDWLRGIARRTESGVLTPRETNLWDLHALSRVNDTLLVRFQTGPPYGTHWEGFKLSLEEYTSFMTGLGFRVVDESEFSPFFHEIVEVQRSSDADAPITLGGVYWPPLMLGRMLFSRGGAYVAGGRNHIRKEIAESSTMYWTFRRRCRPCHDLSEGWGSNSQWRTDVRTDYQIGDALIYNAHGARDLAGLECDYADNGYTYSELVELVTHRCFITADKPHLWAGPRVYPYEYRYTWTPRAGRRPISGTLCGKTKESGAAGAGR